MNDPVKNPRHFEALYPVDSRESEIGKIVDYVRNGNSCQVVSLPGVGRSNLLGLLSYNRKVRIKHFGESQQEKFHFVLLNFSEIRKKPSAEAMKFLFVGLVDSLRERKMLKDYQQAQALLNETLSTGDEMLVLQGLKNMVDFFCLEKKMTIIFLFDRFEEYVPMLTQEFFSNLRILRNRAKYKFSVVFSLNRPLEDVVEPITLSDFYEFLEDNIIYLPVKDEPGLSFRISYFEKTNKVNAQKKILDEILNLTGGHGKLTRLCLEAYFSVAKVEGDLSEFLLDKQRVRIVLREIWNFLTPQEQIFVQASQTSPFLEKVGLLQEKKIAIPLLGLYANQKQERVQETIEEEKFIFDSEKNEILKSSIVVSDRLTALEFKLLKFFLQNPETVVERDLMVSAVWGDLASTQGVTDQALDQLLFRLRKKIEENPQNPAHIQTVKGRGIKFTP